MFPTSRLRGVLAGRRQFVCFLNHSEFMGWTGRNVMGGTDCSAVRCWRAQMPTANITKYSNSAVDEVMRG